MDRHTIQTVQRAVKRKARKVARPVPVNGERIVYCCLCRKSNYEVEKILYDPFISLCSECIDSLAVFLKQLRDKDHG